MPARNPAYVATPTPSFCWDCGEPLPDFHAGRCDACAARANWIPIAPHCTKCGSAMLYAVGSPMAKFNPKCRCEEE